LLMLLPAPESKMHRLLVAASPQLPTRALH
jgi:hypothetical protein